jgi:hypothetical protein
MAETKTAPHSFVKDGVFYFVRRVPKDLQNNYTSTKISFSLRTRSANVAATRAVRAAQSLDESWYFLRVNDCDLPVKHMLNLTQNSNAVPAIMGMTTAAAEIGRRFGLRTSHFAIFRCRPTGSQGGIPTAADL